MIDGGPTGGATGSGTAGDGTAGDGTAGDGTAGNPAAGAAAVSRAASPAFTPPRQAVNPNASTTTTEAILRTVATVAAVGTE